MRTAVKARLITSEFGSRVTWPINLALDIHIEYRMKAYTDGDLTINFDRCASNMKLNNTTSMRVQLITVQVCTYSYKVGAIRLIVATCTFHVLACLILA